MSIINQLKKTIIIMKNLLYLIFVPLFLFSCEEAKDAGDKAGDTIQEAAKDVEDAAKSGWASLEQEWEDIDGQIKAELEDLEDEIENATGDAKSDLESRRDQLNEWQDEMSDRFESGWEKSKDNWEDFSTSTKNKFNEIKRDLKG